VARRRLERRAHARGHARRDLVGGDVAGGLARGSVAAVDRELERLRLVAGDLHRVGGLGGVRRLVVGVGGVAGHGSEERERDR